MSRAAPGQNLIVRATDTDIMVILLFHASQLTSNLWMDLGYSKNNTRSYVDITALANHLGPVLCKALPGYHALTGCDYTSPFFRKGKVKPLQLAQKSVHHIEGLGGLGESRTFDDDDKLVERYVCSLYGKETLSSVNDARLQIFLQKYKPANTESPMDKIKGIDAGMLPPCEKVLNQKLARSNYVAYLWKHANLRDPLQDMEPTDHGWKQANGVFVPVWFTGSQMPTSLSATLEPDGMDGDVDDEDDREDYDSDSGSEDEDCSDEEEEGTHRQFIFYFK